MKPRLGVYIHIPFCASKCGYCDFYSLAGCDKQMPVYHKALIDHILEASPGIRNYEVDSVYFGGGTPSYYGAERLLELFDILKLNGNVRTDAEVTVECNPDSMDYKELLALREEGVNRLSVGIQAADDSLLKLLSRRHSWAQAQAAYHDARRAGFDNISVDLMYGLPTQTARDWADTLARVCELHPEHISCYALKLEEGTPMYEEYLNSPVLPDDDAQADMYSYAAQMLERYGYRQYEVSNFAAPGFEGAFQRRQPALQLRARPAAVHLRCRPQGQHHRRIRGDRPAGALGGIPHALHANQSRRGGAGIPRPHPVGLAAHPPGAPGFRAEGLGRA